jgi:hypothetical protein
MKDWALYLFLGIFLLLHGINSVSNIDVLWMDGLCGFAALIAGVLCLVYALPRRIQ